MAAFLVDDLPGDDKNVVISVRPFSADPYTRAERLDVYTGRRSPLARAPVRNADFVTDHTGTVRFAVGAGTDTRRKLYYRTGEGAEWQLINDEAATQRAEWPIGFSEDDRTAYLIAEQDQGPNAIIEYDIATGARKVALRDDDTDPGRVIYRNGSAVPVGAFFMDGKRGQLRRLRRADGLG